MRRIGLAIMAAAVAAMGASVSASPGPDEGLRAANAAEVSAILANDQATLGRLWAESFVVTNPFNTLVHKPQVLALMASGVFQFSSLERTIDYIQDYGDISVVAGSETGVWAGHSPMTGKLSHFRFTSVWRHGGHGWVEIARHANIVPSGQPASATSPPG